VLVRGRWTGAARVALSGVGLSGVLCCGANDVTGAQTTGTTAASDTTGASPATGVDSSVEGGADTTTGGTGGATTTGGQTAGQTTGEPDGPVQTVTITFATASEDEVSANAAGLQLCLNEQTCLAMPRPHRDDAGKREAGPLQFDVHAHEGLALERQDIDRFELRAEGEAPFVPQCLAIAFDGEPVLCTRQFEQPLGRAWSVDVGASSDCESCFARDTDTDMKLTHGPFVGERDAVAGRARVWIRTDASRTVELHMSTSADMSDAWLAASVVPQAADDFTAELVVEGLAAGGNYYYQLSVDGQPVVPTVDDAWHPDGVYPLRMPPPLGESGAFTFAVSSCARMFAHGNYDAVRDQGPAFLLNLGDYHYGNVARTHFVDRGGSGDLRTARDELRWWYRTAHWEKASLFAVVPFLDTWDDHDYGGDQADADKEIDGRADIRATFLEYFANGERDRAANDEGVYFRSSYGDVDFFVLDARYHRPRLVETDAGFVAPDPDADPLGATQTDWLVEQLAASTATFKFVAAGTRFYDGSGAKAWGPFEVARDALLTRIAEEGIGGVILLAGGPHVSEYRQFTVAGRTWYELISSPISSGLGQCSGAAGQVDCYDEVKNSLAIDVDTTLADPTVSARIVTFDGEKNWPGSGPSVVIARSSLE